MSVSYGFPTPIWHIRNDGSHPDEILEWALSFDRSRGTSRSNRFGFQTDASWDYDELPHKEYVANALKFLPSFEFQNWWLNINERGGYNVAHTHPQCDLSVVWYLTNNHTGLIKFLSPFQHVRDKLNKTIGLENECGWKCDKGDIIVFPSDLLHYVEPNESDEPRVSIAFNLRLL
jgi:hypothetical protein